MILIASLFLTDFYILSFMKKKDTGILYHCI